MKSECRLLQGGGKSLLFACIGSSYSILSFEVVIVGYSTEKTIQMFHGTPPIQEQPD
jgi:hypothetical protein